MSHSTVKIQGCPKRIRRIVVRESSRKARIKDRLVHRRRRNLRNFLGSQGSRRTRRLGITRVLKEEMPLGTTVTVYYDRLPAVTRNNRKRSRPEQVV